MRRTKAQRSSLLASGQSARDRSMVLFKIPTDEFPVYDLTLPALLQLAISHVYSIQERGTYCKFTVIFTFPCWYEA